MMQLGMQLRGGLQAECSTRPAAVQPQCRLLLPVRRRCGVAARLAPSSSGLLQQRGRGRSQLLVVATYPVPETEKERSPIDIPQEWITPPPSRRPDIFPEFEKQQTPLPKPMPGDPEVPDEEEEEEKKKKDPETDPDKEPGEEPEKKPDEPAPSE